MTSTASPPHAQGQEGPPETIPDSPFLTTGSKASGQGELGPEYLLEGKSLGEWQGTGGGGGTVASDQLPSCLQLAMRHHHPHP